MHGCFANHSSKLFIGTWNVIHGLSDVGDREQFGRLQQVESFFHPCPWFKQYLSNACMGLLRVALQKTCGRKACLSWKGLSHVVRFRNHNRM